MEILTLQRKVKQQTRSLSRVSVPVTWSFTTKNIPFTSQAAVNLGTAGTFAILSQMFRIPIPFHRNCCQSAFYLTQVIRRQFDRNGSPPGATALSYRNRNDPGFCASSLGDLLDALRLAVEALSSWATIVV